MTCCKSFITISLFTLLALGPQTTLAEVGSSAAANVPSFSACPDPASSPTTVPTPCLAIAKFDTSLTRNERANAVRGSGAAIRFNYSVVSASAVMVPSQRAYRALANHPSLVRLIPDRPVRTFAPPGACSPWPACKDGGDEADSGGSEVVPAGVVRVGADSAWDQNITGSGVVVAIVDTGLDSDHPDLAANIIGGATCLGDENGAVCNEEDGGEDDNGHGTHVGGTVAAIQGNGTDVVGVAPGAQLEPVKVLDSSGSGWDSNIIAGLDWVYTRGTARVVNMSLGREGACLDDLADPSAHMVRQAIQALVSDGVSVVVAAGNDRSKEVKDMVPAGCPEVIAVASTTAQDGTNKCNRLSGYIEADTASFFTTDGAMDSNGVGVTISAPGATREDNTCGTIQAVGILSLAMGGGVTEKIGTSMASPHVTGLVALLLEDSPSLTPEQVRDQLRNNADFSGTTPKDHPFINESLDGEQEGIGYAPSLLGPGS